MTEAPGAAHQYGVIDGRLSPREPGPHAELAYALKMFLQSWSERALAAGKIPPFSVAHLVAFRDGTARITAGTVQIGGPDTPIAETFAEAERFLIRDEKAECNIAIGLLPDGRYVAAAVDPRDPDHSRPAPFDYHNCWKCDNGRKPCANGRAGGCENLHARND